MDHSSQKVCIINELRNFVTTMLSAQSFSGSPLRSQDMAKSQNVETGGRQFKSSKTIDLTRQWMTEAFRNDRSEEELTLKVGEFWKREFEVEYQCFSLGQIYFWVCPGV
jgi:hypothetical protein